MTNIHIFIIFIFLFNKLYRILRYFSLSLAILQNFNDTIVISEIISLIQAQKSVLSISDFKNISRLTRKNAIPILEYFDSRKFTKREGNDRQAGETLFVK